MIKDYNDYKDLDITEFGLAKSDVISDNNSTYSFLLDPELEPNLDFLLFKGITAIQEELYIDDCIEAGYWLPGRESFMGSETIQKIYQALINRTVGEADTGMKQLTLPFHSDTAINANINTRCSILALDNTVLVPKYCSLSLFNAFPHNTTNYYTISGAMAYSSTFTSINGNVVNTKSAASANTWHSYILEFAATEFVHQYNIFYLNVTKTGNPGNVWIVATFYYEQNDV
jgi:hypothetical protein